MSEVTATIDTEAPTPEQLQLWYHDEDIHGAFRRQTIVQNLTEGDTITITASNGVTLTATVTDCPPEDPEDQPENVTYALDVDSITGTRHPDDEVIIVIDRAGADGSFGKWRGVPYLTVLPKDTSKPTYGDITSITLE